MFKYLRIAFCVIAVALTAACIFVFIYAGLAWGFVVAAAAIVCYFLMVFFKKKQEETDGTANPADTAPQGDFITGRVTADSATDRYTAYNSVITVEQPDGTQRTFLLTKGDKDTFDKVGTKTALGRAIWHKQIGDEIAYKDSDLNDVTLKIIDIE